METLVTTGQGDADQATARQVDRSSRIGMRPTSKAATFGILVLGVTFLTISGPIVASRAMKIGWDALTILGASAVVASVAIIAVYSVRLIRAAPRWHKLLALPVAFVLVQFVVWPLGNAVYTTNAARPPLGVQTPADLGMAYETMTFPAPDGTELAAWYIPGRNGSVVIVRHGSGSTRTSTLEHASLLAEAGFGVFMTDARGHGESDGQINELGWHGGSDISAAIDVLEERGITQIGVLGLSMGGEEGLIAAAEDARIDAVVSEGATISNYNDAVARGASSLERVVDRLQFGLTDLLSDASQPEGISETIAQISPRPILLIAGESAREVEMGRLYVEKAGANAALWESGTSHTDGLASRPDTYQRKVLTLFDRALLGLATN